jgi:ribosomal protein L7/L12
MLLESLRCPSCGSPSANQSQHNDYLCDHCGTISRLSSDQNMLIMVSWKCSSCRTRNEQGSGYCGNCGTQLVKYCFTCGSRTQGIAAHCPQCGGQDFSAKVGFDVILEDYPPSVKINLVKLVREVTGLDMSSALAIVERPGSRITRADFRALADAIKTRFEAAGASVRIVAPRD